MDNNVNVVLLYKLSSRDFAVEIENKNSTAVTVEVKLTKGAGGKVFAQLTNKSDKTIEDAEISVLFYYQNKIVGG